jgi:hypothetical protein
MCLRVQSELLTAAEDVVCYKVIKEFDFGRNRGYSLFMDARIYDDEINGYMPYVPAFLDNSDYYIEDGCARNGYIHTYANIIGAEKCANEFKKQCSSNYPYDIVIYKCIIPKGQQYYSGSDQYTWCDAYASKQIYFKEKVKTITI